MNRLPRLLLVLVLVVATAIVLGTGPMLPARVASHFGPGGVANDWMPRAAYLAVMLGLVTLLPLLVAATTGLMPRWSRRNRLMRDPGYWLAPPRREATEAFLAATACAAASVLSLYMLGLHLLTLVANASDPARLPMPAFYALTGVFLALTGTWMAGLYLRFRAPG